MYKNLRITSKAGKPGENRETKMIRVRTEDKSARYCIRWRRVGVRGERSGNGVEEGPPTRGWLTRTSGLTRTAIVLQNKGRDLRAGEWSVTSHWVICCGEGGFFCRREQCENGARKLKTEKGDYTTMLAERDAKTYSRSK